jgi:hypothetical protein
LNRCPTRAVLDLTPEEAWSGYKPNVAYMIIFGCIAYAHSLKKGGINWMIKALSVFSLVIAHKQEVIGYLIPKRSRL